MLPLQLKIQEREWRNEKMNEESSLGRSNSFRLIIDFLPTTGSPIYQRILMMAHFGFDRATSPLESDASAPTEIMRLRVRDVRTPRLEFVFEGSPAAMIKVARELRQEELVEAPQRAPDDSSPSSPVRSRVPPCPACSDSCHTYLSCPIFIRDMALPTQTVESCIPAPQPADPPRPDSPYYTPLSPDYTPRSPYYTPLSPDYTPRSPYYTPLSPTYTPLNPAYVPLGSDYVPLSPEYFPGHPDDVPDGSRS